MLYLRCACGTADATGLGVRCTLHVAAHYMCLGVHVSRTRDTHAWSGLQHAVKSAGPHRGRGHASTYCHAVRCMCCAVCCRRYVAPCVMHAARCMSTGTLLHVVFCRLHVACVQHDGNRCRSAVTISLRPCCRLYSHCPAAADATKSRCPTKAAVLTYPAHFVPSFSSLPLSAWRHSGLAGLSPT